uniref:RNase H type-1 domain-containing protein n=1 Tax=Quercus lobata TaxID=97700 RepID=A0A7N2KYF6_QUELO
MNIDTGCHACSTSDGSILPVLRDCTVAINFWLRSGLPDLNWFKLNIDGSSIGNPGKAGGGGIIRNQHGNRVRGFARSIGIASSVVAEL